MGFLSGSLGSSSLEVLVCVGGGEGGSLRTLDLQGPECVAETPYEAGITSSAGCWPRLPRDKASLAASCHLLGAGRHCAN